VIGTAALISGNAFAAGTPPCPDTSIGESAQDCPWAGVARELIAEGKQGQAVGPRLAKLLPKLDKDLQEDAQRVAWKKLWGQSINFDEMVKDEIVNPKIIKALADRMKIAQPFEIIHVREEPPRDGALAELEAPALRASDDAGHSLVHAGLEHTYGYLFSILKTSFGFKRARWVSGEIENGFGLPVGVLGPKPSQGTLFSNVTFFAGNIAFRKEPGKIKVLKEGASKLPKTLREFNFASLKVQRLDETVTAKDAAGKMRTVTLHTDFVSFPQTPGHELLIYSVTDPSREGSVLITAFPVDQKFVEMVLAPQELGSAKTVKTRYNAFVQGVSGKTLQGTRKIDP
jgi:hypothetical protein